MSKHTICAHESIRAQKRTISRFSFCIPGNPDPSVLEAIDYFNEFGGGGLTAGGGLTVFAAGNDDSDALYYPSAYPGAIAVAASFHLVRLLVVKLPVFTSCVLLFRAKLDFLVLWWPVSSWTLVPHPGNAPLSQRVIHEEFCRPDCLSSISSPPMPFSSHARAAVDDNFYKPDFSNYGSWVDVAAPGVGILSTVFVSESTYGRKDGTSFSCPMVAGVLALMLSAAPGRPRQEYIDCLYQTARDVSTLSPNIGERARSERMLVRVSCVNFERGAGI
eukprot:4008030-Pleurochrysis_carterae.AAC.2